MTKLAQKLI